MQNVIRFTLTLLFVGVLSGVAMAAKTATAPKEAEYKRADTNFYWKGDVLKVDPNAVIFTDGHYTQKGDSYFITPKKKAPEVIYIQVTNEWIEPITPPDMPASLGVPPDVMQIREPQGDVQVAFPSAPATFVPATAGMTIPNGSVVKTGGNGSVAILFGGVASARLIPNSEAAVQQTVDAKSHTTEVDLSKGAVFSKVGQRIGEKEDYRVKTPFGVAAARGTDFVTVAMPARMDVWIAQGTVQLDQPDGKMVGVVKSDGGGPLKIIRNPPMPNAHDTMMASAETMTAAMNFIPTVNLKIKALHDKVAQGIKLTPTEQDYLNRIKKVPCLIKLALVPPPAPPAPAPAPAPVPAPVVKPAPAPAPAPAAPAKLKAINLRVHSDGKVGLDHKDYTADDFKAKVEAIAKATPDQPVIIKAGKKTTPEQIDQITKLCRDAGLKNVVVSEPAAIPAPTTAVTKPGAMPAPVVPTPTPTPAPTPKPTPLPPAMELPMNLELRPDGKVDFEGATVTLDDLKVKLEEISVIKPNQPLVIVGREKVTRQQLKKVVAVCHEANLKKVTIAKAAPMPATSVPTPAVASADKSTSVASNQPAPVKHTSHHTANASSDADGALPTVPLLTGPGDTVP